MCQQIPANEALRGIPEPRELCRQACLAPCTMPPKEWLICHGPGYLAHDFGSYTRLIHQVLYRREKFVISDDLLIVNSGGTQPACGSSLADHHPAERLSPWMAALRDTCYPARSGL